MGILSFWRERHWSQNSYYGNNFKGLICFFLVDDTFMVPRFKNTALIFPEISFIQFSPLFSCCGITSSLI